jgi:hypothetical protein
MVTADDIRKVALSLPRTEEALVRDQVKFRVGQIVAQPGRTVDGLRISEG